MKKEQLDSLYTKLNNDHLLTNINPILSEKAGLKYIYNILKKILMSLLRPILMPILAQQSEVNSQIIQILNHYHEKSDSSDTHSDNRTINKAPIIIDDPRQSLKQQIIAEHRLHDFPDIGEKRLKVLLDTTTRCNLRCIMCYFSKIKDGTPHYEISLEEFDKLANEVFPFAFSVHLSCATEPLMNKHFEEFLKKTALFNVPVVGYVTNGLLLNERIINCTLESKVNLVNISIDAARKETYESIRINSNFDKVISNVKMLKKMKEQHKSRLPEICITCVLMRRNFREAIDLMKLAKEIGIDQVGFCHMVSYEGIDSKEESLISCKEETNEIIDKIQEMARILNIKIATIPEKFSLSNSPGEPAVMRRKFCLSPWTQAIFAVSGDLRPCSYGWAYEPMGNVKKEKFLDIWNNNKYLRLHYRMLSSQLLPCCQTCPPIGAGDIDDPDAFKPRIL